MERAKGLFKMNFSVFRVVQPSNYRAALPPYYVPQSLAQPVDLPVVLDHLFISLCVCVMCSAGECTVLCTWRSEGSFVGTLLSFSILWVQLGLPSLLCLSASAFTPSAVLPAWIYLLWTFYEPSDSVEVWSFVP